MTTLCWLAETSQTLPSFLEPRHSLWHPFGLISSRIFFYFRSVLIANWHTMADRTAWDSKGLMGWRVEGRQQLPCLNWQSSLAAAISKPLEAVRHTSLHGPFPFFFSSLSLYSSTKWGQQSSEQIGLLLNCLVNGYNDTINCMSAAQLALKSGTLLQPATPAPLTPTSPYCLHASPICGCCCQHELLFLTKFNMLKIN